MEDNKKVTLSERSIEQIAKTIAIADLAARTPKEKNPSIPMVEDELYHSTMEKGIAKYNALKLMGKAID